MKKNVLKIFSIVIVIVILLGLMIMFPSIINLFSDFIKNVNPVYKDMNLSKSDWLNFYGIILGSIITLFTILSSVMFGIYQMRKQHDENAATLNYQTGLNDLQISQEKISNLLYSYTRTDQMRNAYCLLAYEKYDESYFCIEAARSEMLKVKHDLFICTDIKENSSYNIDKKLLYKYKKVKNSIANSINKLDEIYEKFFSSFQEHLTAMKQKNTVENEIAVHNKLIAVLSEQIVRWESINNDHKYDQKISDNYQEIEKVKKELENLKSKLITEDEMTKVRNKLNEEVEQLNKTITEHSWKLIDCSKKYVLLKREINIVIYNMKFIKKTK